MLASPLHPKPPPHSGTPPPDAPPALAARAPLPPGCSHLTGWSRCGCMEAKRRSRSEGAKGAAQQRVPPQSARLLTSAGLELERLQKHSATHGGSNQLVQRLFAGTGRRQLPCKPQPLNMRPGSGSSSAYAAQPMQFNPPPTAVQNRPACLGLRAVWRLMASANAVRHSSACSCVWEAGAAQQIYSVPPDDCNKHVCQTAAQQLAAGGNRKPSAFTSQ